MTFRGPHSPINWPGGLMVLPVRCFRSGNPAGVRATAQTLRLQRTGRSPAWWAPLGVDHRACTTSPARSTPGGRSVTEGVAVTGTVSWTMHTCLAHGVCTRLYDGSFTHAHLDETYSRRSRGSTMATIWSTHHIDLTRADARAADSLWPSRGGLHGTTRIAGAVLPHAAADPQRHD